MTNNLISRQAAVSRFSDLLMVELKGKRLPTWDEVYNAIQDVPSERTDLITKMRNGIKATDADDAYSFGMRNGIRWCISLIDDKEPSYESCPHYGVETKKG